MKLVLNKIPAKDFLFYDERVFKIFAPFLITNCKNWSYLSLEKINLRVVWELLKKRLKLNYLNYCNQYLQKVKPKKVFTFTDNDPNFYQLALKNPDIKFIAIQSTYRGIAGDLFSQKTENKKIIKNLKIFVFSNAFKNNYKKLFNCNIEINGSFLGNIFLKKLKNYPIKKLVWISEFRNHLSFPYTVATKMNIKKFQDIYKHEKRIFNKVKTICKVLKLELIILGAKVNKKLANKEHIFYKNLLKSFDNWNFVERVTLYSNYQKIASDCIILFNHSTLGYEAFGAGYKVFCMNRGYLFKNELDRKFGWPNKFLDFGICWNNNILKKPFEKQLKAVIKMPTKAYLEKTYKIRKKTMARSNNIKILNELKTIW